MASLSFVDDTLMFLKASNVNISARLTRLALYGDASDLTLNLTKSTLIDVSATNFDALQWPGKRVQKGSIFRYLGYPLGVQISNKDAIDWVLKKVTGKIFCWHSSEWPLHV